MTGKDVVTKLKYTCQGTRDPAVDMMVALTAGISNFTTTTHVTPSHDPPLTGLEVTHAQLSHENHTDENHFTFSHF